MFDCLASRLNRLCIEVVMGKQDYAPQSRYTPCMSHPPFSSRQDYIFFFSGSDLFFSEKKSQIREIILVVKFSRFSFRKTSNLCIAAFVCVNPLPTECFNKGRKCFLIKGSVSRMYTYENKNLKLSDNIERSWT